MTVATGRGKDAEATELRGQVRSQMEFGNEGTFVKIILKPFYFQPNPQQGTHEMSYPNTQALIESLLTLVKILARRRDLRLQPSTRAP